MSAATVHQLPTITEQIIETGGLYGSIHYRMVTLAGQLDASDEWLLEANSPAHWIADVLDMCISTAREWVRIGRSLRDLPLLDTAFGEHELSYSKVRTISRVATADNEADLIDIGLRTPANQLGVELARYLHGTETPTARRKRQRKSTVFRTWTDVSGMTCGFFRLPPVAAAGPLAAIDALVMSTPPKVKADIADSARNASADAPHDGVDVDDEGWPSLGQQRADAFAQLGTGDGVDYEVILHVRADGCTLDGGTPIDLVDIERLAPKAFIRALIHDIDGKPVEATNRRRHPTTRQKRVVKERDRYCTDCGSTDLPEYDHNPAHEQTGHTITDELELRCAPCHHRRHRNEAA